MASLLFVGQLAVKVSVMQFVWSDEAPSFALVQVAVAAAPNREVQAPVYSPGISKQACVGQDAAAVAVVVVVVGIVFVVVEVVVVMVVTVVVVVGDVVVVVVVVVV
jgi:hypothetical protein